MILKYPIESQSELLLDAEGAVLKLDAVIVCRDGCPVHVEIETEEGEEDRPIFRIDDGHLVAESQPAVEKIFMIVVAQIEKEIHAYDDGVSAPSS